MTALLKEKPLWRWDLTPEEHKLQWEATNQRCCFGHIVGLPVNKKTGKVNPFFDYELEIFRLLIQGLHVWIKKASGLGITTFSLYFIAWMCSCFDYWKGSTVCIVTGPNITLATELIDMLKGIFVDLEDRGHVKWDSEKTIAYINGVRIQAFPSHNLSAMRGLPYVSFILIDEGDFFPKGQQFEVRYVSERYIAKSGAQLMMVSTPHKPGGLFERIEHETNSIYTKKFYNYTWGIGKVYTQKEIDEAMKSSTFGREYDLQYLGLVGNVFNATDISYCLELGKVKKNTFIDQKYLTNQYPTTIGIDPAWGSSNFGIVVTRYIDKKIYVMYAKEFEKPQHDYMIKLVKNLYEDMYPYEHTKIFVDGANAGWIRSLKTALKEYPDYHLFPKDRLKKLIFSQNGMTVCPINFSEHGQNMLENSRLLMERKRIVIPPVDVIGEDYLKLTTALRTAHIDPYSGKLDKEDTSYDDLFDAFRLALMNYKSK